MLCRDEVAGLYASLARMCLDLGRTDSADDIIAAAERHRFPVDDRIMAALMAALGGRERRAQVQSRCCWVATPRRAIHARLLGSACSSGMAAYDRMLLSIFQCNVF